ncbi:hypothetical protein L5515_019282 [Caenorhabditis briggsae]|uniref:Uncharacterized protein n=1 Tax=Caenorhabditis briggsae TaxID=6238 RepID=A0AAE9FIX9_CAEBR|nr:hypothetical protein L5515_019282 [Caenorhabditis briggsae]
MAQIGLQDGNGLLESPFVSTSTISTLNSIQFEVDIELASPEPAPETTTPVEAEDGKEEKQIEEPKRKILDYVQSVGQTLIRKLRSRAEN